MLLFEADSFRFTHQSCRSIQCITYTPFITFSACDQSNEIDSIGRNEPLQRAVELGQAT